MTKAMGIEENKKLARRQWEALGAGNFDLMGQGYDDNVLYHGGAGEERRGKAAALDLAKMYRTAFPDVRVTIEDMIAEGDRVFTRVRPQATHTGELMGMPPTGKKIDLQWVMNVVRIANGKIVEEWEIFNQMDLMRQLGAIPPEA
jgi:steroid delta-isomerase-like uncharacterized protein